MRVPGGGGGRGGGGGGGAGGGEEGQGITAYSKKAGMITGVCASVWESVVLETQLTVAEVMPGKILRMPTLAFISVCTVNLSSSPPRYTEPQSTEVKETKAANTNSLNAGKVFSPLLAGIEEPFIAAIDSLHQAHSNHSKILLSQVLPMCCPPTININLQDGQGRKVGTSESVHGCRIKLAATVSTKELAIEEYADLHTCVHTHTHTHTHTMTAEEEPNAESHSVSTSGIMYSPQTMRASSRLSLPSLLSCIRGTCSGGHHRAAHYTFSMQYVYR